MTETLSRLYQSGTLDREDACNMLRKITKGDFNDAQVTSFISVFLMRRPTLDEMAGFRDLMMEQCQPVALDEFDPVDIVGTGGDGKNTFNISTLSAIVLAGAGIKVAKHGNYGSTAISGSSNVLEYLGYSFTASEDLLKRGLEQNNICFLHAPLFHPAMKRVAGIRKDIGLRTFFNLLGPLINPASPGKLVLGVSHLEYTRLYSYLLQNMPVRFQIIHSLDGYDEISLTGLFKITTAGGTTMYHPGDLGLPLLQPEDLLIRGEDIHTAASLFLNILKGTGTPAQEAVVIANSGFAIHCVLPEKSLEDCFAMAKESLHNKKAYQIFTQLTHTR